MTSRNERSELERLNREYARQVVANTPPMTAEQRAQVVALLRTVRVPKPRGVGNDAA